LDLDVFKLNGQSGEQVTIKLQANPSGSYSGQNAALTLTGPKMFKRDAGPGLPNEIVTSLPRSGVFEISVGNLLVQKPRFVGDYCVSLESSAGAQYTLRPAFSVE
jgi:hypothetical protein